ncbi:MAG: hypothetical protein ACREN8_10070 [Candidatus Dormibacteraceae bacterium]
MRIDELLDRLDQVISQGRRLPFSRNVVLDEEEMRELIDQLREGLPEDIKQANWTVREQQRLLGEAQAEAARIVAMAEQRTDNSYLEREALRRVKLESQKIIKVAQGKAAKVEEGADAYALAQLQQLEAHLSRTLMSIRRGVERLNTKGSLNREDSRFNN